jgi:formylglycine-generating enzyme required for sulfatase activity
MKKKTIIWFALITFGLSPMLFVSRSAFATESRKGVSIEEMEKELYEEEDILEKLNDPNISDEEKERLFLLDKRRKKRQAKIAKIRQKNKAKIELKRKQLMQLRTQYITDGIPEPEMVTIPGGQFDMGCLAGNECNSVELPAHGVQISSFEMSATEITFEQWDACVTLGGCDHYPNDKGRGRGKRPVVNITWKDAQQYISWLNKQSGKKYRLPSEAEWEYAARAGSNTLYSWGNLPGTNNANCKGCGSKWDYKKTAPVGSFKKNGFGLYDMHGNVFEWVQDCWHRSYEGAPIDGSDWQEDESCNFRVRKGGSWNYATSAMRAANREAVATDGYRDKNLGFRVVRTTH